MKFSSAPGLARGWRAGTDIRPRVRSVLGHERSTSARHPGWAPNPPPKIWKTPGTTASERAQEQDEAAGGRERRLVREGSEVVATASVALKSWRGSRRVYAYLRFWRGGRTEVRYIGDVTLPTREEALRRAWVVAREKRLLDIER